MRPLKKLNGFKYPLKKIVYERFSLVPRDNFRQSNIIYTENNINDYKRCKFCKCLFFVMEDSNEFCNKLCYREYSEVFMNVKIK